MGLPLKPHGIQRWDWICSEVSKMVSNWFFDVFNVLYLVKKKRHEKHRCAFWTVRDYVCWSKENFMVANLCRWLCFCPCKCINLWTGYLKNFGWNHQRVGKCAWGATESCLMVIPLVIWVQDVFKHFFHDRDNFFPWNCLLWCFKVCIKHKYNIIKAWTSQVHVPNVIQVFSLASFVLDISCSFNVCYFYFKTQ